MVNFFSSSRNNDYIFFKNNLTLETHLLSHFRPDPISRLYSTGRVRWTANIQMRDVDILRRDLALIVLAKDHRILGESPELGPNLNLSSYNWPPQEYLWSRKSQNCENWTWSPWWGTDILGAYYLWVYYYSPQIFSAPIEPYNYGRPSPLE